MAAPLAAPIGGPGVHLPIRVPTKVLEKLRQDSMTNFINGNIEVPMPQHDLHYWVNVRHILTLHGMNNQDNVTYHNNTLGLSRFLRGHHSYTTKVSSHLAIISLPSPIVRCHMANECTHNANPVHIMTYKYMLYTPQQLGDLAQRVALYIITPAFDVNSGNEYNEINWSRGTGKMMKINTKDQVSIEVPHFDLSVGRYKVEGGYLVWTLIQTSGVLGAYRFTFAPEADYVDIPLPATKALHVVVTDYNYEGPVSVPSYNANYGDSKYLVPVYQAISSYKFYSFGSLLQVKHKGNDILIPKELIQVAANASAMKVRDIHTFNSALNQVKTAIKKMVVNTENTALVITRATEVGFIMNLDDEFNSLSSINQFNDQFKLHASLLKFDMPVPVTVKVTNFRLSMTAIAAGFAFASYRTKSYIPLVVAATCVTIGWLTPIGVTNPNAPLPSLIPAATGSLFQNVIKMIWDLGALLFSSRIFDIRYSSYLPSALKKLFARKGRKPKIAVTYTCVEGTPLEKMHPSAKMTQPAKFKSCTPTMAAYAVGQHISGFEPVIPSTCSHNTIIALRNRTLNAPNRPLSEISIHTVMLNEFYHKSPEMADIRSYVSKLHPWNFSEWISRFPAARQADIMRGKQYADASEYVDSYEKSNSTFIKIEKLLKRNYGTTYQFSPRVIQGRSPVYQYYTGPITYTFTQLFKQVWNGKDSASITMRYENQPEVNDTLFHKNRTIYYTSGATAETLGSWYSSALVWAGDQITILEDDFSRFDASQERPITTLELSILTSLVNRHCLDYPHIYKFLMSGVETKGITHDGIKYSVPGKHKSGEGYTSVGNTLLNALVHCFAIDALIHKFNIKAKVHDICRMALLGDDNLLIFKLILTEDMINFIADTIKNFGLKPKLVKSTKYTAKYCSGRFYPIQTKNGPSFSWGPSIGRVMCKTFWRLVNDQFPGTDQDWLYSVIYGMKNELSYIPILNAYAKRVLDNGGTYIQIKDWKIHASEAHEVCDETYVMMQEAYGLTKSVIDDIETHMSNIPIDSYLGYSMFEDILTADGIIDEGVPVEDRQSSTLIFPASGSLLQTTTYPILYVVLPLIAPFYEEWIKRRLLAPYFGSFGSGFVFGLLEGFTELAIYIDDPDRTEFLAMFLFRVVSHSLCATGPYIRGVALHFLWNTIATWPFWSAAIQGADVNGVYSMEQTDPMRPFSEGISKGIRFWGRTLLSYIDRPGSYIAETCYNFLNYMAGVGQRYEETLKQNATEAQKFFTVTTTPPAAGMLNPAKWFRHGRWCGEGWSDGTEQESVSQPGQYVDDFDKSCMEHDNSYANGNAIEADEEFFKKNFLNGFKPTAAALVIKANRFFRPTYGTKNLTTGPGEIRVGSTLESDSMPRNKRHNKKGSAKPKHKTHKNAPKNKRRVNKRRWDAPREIVTKLPVNASTVNRNYGTPPFDSSVIPGSDLVGNIVSTGGDTPGTIYMLNPINPTRFVNARLNRLAGLFEEWEIIGLEFYYVRSANANFSGSFILAIDYDPSDAISYTVSTVSGLQSKAIMSFTTEENIARLYYNKSNQVFKKLYVDSSTEARTANAGNLVALCSVPPSVNGVSPANGTILGQIWARYVFKFRVACNQLPVSAAIQIYGGITAGISTFPYGSTINPAGGTSISVTNNGNTITFVGAPAGAVRFTCHSNLNLSWTASGNYSISQVVGAITSLITFTTISFAAVSGSSSPMLMVATFVNPVQQNVTISFDRGGATSATSYSTTILYLITPTLNKTKQAKLEDEVAKLASDLAELRMRRATTPVISYTME